MTTKKKSNTQRDESTLLKERLKRPERHKVVLHNDDFTPMEFVVDVFVKVLGLSYDHAVEVMFEAHRTGRASCGLFSAEVAETKVERILELAYQKGYPLRCEVVWL